MNETLLWKCFALGLLIILVILILNMSAEIKNYNDIVCTNCVNEWLNRTGYGLLIP